MLAKIAIAPLILLLVATSCRSRSRISAYDDLHRQPPYAGLTDSIRREPKNADLLVRRAERLIGQGHQGAALEDLRNAWNQQKEERTALGLAGLLEELRADSALLFLEEAVRILPASQRLRFAYAQACLAAAQHDKALMACDEWLAVNPSATEAIKLKASAQEQKGDSAAALRTWEQAYSGAASDPELTFILALRYAQLRDPRVLSLCDSLIRTDAEGRQADPYYYQGIYYANKGDRKKALSLFNEAIRRDYHFREAYIEKGSLQYEGGGLTEALETFELLRAVSPQYADAYYWIAKCQEAQGRLPEARLNYARAWQLDNTLEQAREGSIRLGK